MTDKEVNNVLQYIMSPDPSNVLIGIELYQQQNNFSRSMIADEFLTVWTGYCVSMYLYADHPTECSHTEGVFEAKAYSDPFYHTAIGLKFQSEWLVCLEMDICKDNIEESSYMTGGGNLYAVMYKQEVEETAVTNKLVKPYWIEGRINPHFNTTRDCIDFFFNAIQKQIYKHINK